MRSTLRQIGRVLSDHASYLEFRRPKQPVPEIAVVRAHIKAFLFDAYRGNEITPQDYTYLRQKAERWSA